MAQSAMTAQDPPAPRQATESQKAAPLPASPKKKFPKLKILVPRRGRTSPNTPTVTDPLINPSPKEARAPIAYGVILTPSNEWIDPGMLKQKLASRRKRMEAMGRGRPPSSAAAPPLGGPLAQFVRRAHSATGSGTVTLNTLGGSASSLRNGDDPDTPLRTPSIA